MPEVPQSIEMKIAGQDNPNVVKKNNVEWDDICREADFYYDAAKKQDKRKNGYKNVLFPPVLMNASFACELYSKAIICRYGGYGAVQDNRTHSLKELYDCFFPYIKDFANRNFNANCCKGYESMINNISDIFEKWRYRYEYEIKDAHCDFVLKYMEILKMTAHDDVEI